jgi:hypothetical protein
MLYRIKLYAKPQYLKKFSDEIFKLKLFVIVIMLVMVGLYLKDKN